MALERWILDTSAFFNLSHSPDSGLWTERIQRGLVGVATATLLEIGYSTRSPADHARVFASPLITNLVSVFSIPADEKRALEVQRSLMVTGSHRAPSISDLLVAALGEREAMTVLHVDKDFDIISAFTGQRVERLAVPAA